MKTKYQLLPKIILSLAGLICWSALAENRILDIRSRVVSHGSTVLLKDLTHRVQLLTASEAELIIFEGRSWKEPLEWTLVDLAYLMQRHTQLHDIQLRGPRRIRVFKGADPERVRQISQRVISEIKQLDPWASWTSKVVLSADDERRLSQISDFVELEVINMDRRDVLGTVSFKVITTDDQGERSDQVTIKPTLMRQIRALVARHPCRRGQVLVDTDLETTEAWIGTSGKTGIEDLGECVGYELRRSVAAGEVIGADDLLKPVCARRGDNIWVTCNYGSIVVAIAARAKSSGRLDEWVELENPESRKLFEAKLTGEKVALLNPRG